MKLHGPFLFGAFLVFLASCANDRSAGGTTETDNMVAARLFRVDSLLADVGLSSDAPTIATLRLNSSNVDFDSTSPDGSDLSVETTDGLSIPFRIVFWDRAATLGRIQVRLDPVLQQPGNHIRLRWGLNRTTRSDSARVWKGITDSQRVTLTSVLVSDFEQASLLSLLPIPNNWYTNAGGDCCSISQPTITSSGAGRSGHALYVSFKAPIKVGFAVAGVPLGEGTYNLRALDSIEFWARGDSTILTVAFDHQAVNAKAWTPRYPDSTWKRFTIRPDQLDAPSVNGGNVGWLGVRDSVSHLSFFTAQGKELWIDDIRLYGIDRNDLK